MFKGFQNTSRSNGFNGFPALNFQMNNEAYGFSGVLYHIDASYGLNTQTNLAAVTLWQPKIGSSYWVQSTAGNQPRLVTSDANFNNNPTIDFYDTSRWMNLFSGSVQVPVSSISTVVWIARMNAVNPDSNSWNTILGNNSSVVNNNYALGGTYGNTTGIGYTTNNNSQAMTTIENTNTHIVVMTDTFCIVDGVSVTFNISLLNNFNTFFWNRLGGSRDLTSQSINGQIAEIIIFPYKLTSNQAIALSNNINSKYAIY